MKHFWSNGHAVKMMVFDDSSLANHQKYYSLLEQTKTANELYYVGPQEKEQFLDFLKRKLRDKNLTSLVRSLFRPSYGGNRNFTLMYTLGAFMVSSDDDMRPHALVEASPESLNADEISRGKLLKAGSPGVLEKSFDLLTSFQDVLGRKVSEIPSNYERGEGVMDTAMDLEPMFRRISRETIPCSCRLDRFRRIPSSRLPRRFVRGRTTSTPSTLFTCTCTTNLSIKQAYMISMTCTCW